MQPAFFIKTRPFANQFLLDLNWGSCPDAQRSHMHSPRRKMRLLALFCCTQLGAAQWLMQAGAHARSGTHAAWHVGDSVS